MGAVMIQGTGSDIGKSLLVAGLCRALSNRGLSVRPFKPQNMSNNAAVAADGGEIGRAQATQAIACRTAPTTDMNPVLLKPQADHSAQLIVHGRVRGTLAAGSYREARKALIGDVLASYRRLRAGCDLVVVEGAGSPAEINLRAGDIANMGFARAADVPVLLAGDIDRGGVIAALVGTRAVIAPEDAAMIQGFIINKFRGDPALFDEGYRAIEQRTGWRGYGVLPWLSSAARLPDEDSMALQRRRNTGSGRLVIACPVTPRIANFDDLDPLKLDPGVEVRMVAPGQPIPAEAALVILAGSKATIADLEFLKAEGWDIDILAHYRRGGHVLGLCGGYQMLGRTIRDPDGLEGPPASVSGLGLLDVDTILTGPKTLRRVSGQALGAPFEGYEIHMGRTDGPDRERPLCHYRDEPSAVPVAEGAMRADGRVSGSYVHGLFALAEQRAAWMARIGGRGGSGGGGGGDAVASGPDHAAAIDAALDEIAAGVEAHLDVDGMIALSEKAS